MYVRWCRRSWSVGAMRRGSCWRSRWSRMPSSSGSTSRAWSEWTKIVYKLAKYLITVYDKEVHTVYVTDSDMIDSEVILFAVIWLCDSTIVVPLLWLKAQHWLPLAFISLLVMLACMFDFSQHVVVFRTLMGLSARWTPQLWFLY